MCGISTIRRPGCQGAAEVSKIRTFIFGQWERALVIAQAVRPQWDLLLNLLMTERKLLFWSEKMEIKSGTFQNQNGRFKGGHTVYNILFLHWSRVILSANVWGCKKDTTKKFL